MSIKVTNDANNGTTRLKGAEVAGDYVVTTPAFSTELAPRMQLMTAQNSTSGTSIDFTGIPSWVKRITVMFNGVSTNGTSVIQVQLGDSGGIENTGYIGEVVLATSGPAVLVFTSAFLLAQQNAVIWTQNGTMDILNIALNTWIEKSTSSVTGIGVNIGAGSKTLSSTLDRIRVTTVNGTDTFDAGQIGVLYEG